MLSTRQLIVPAVANEHACRWLDSQLACRAQVDLRIGLGHTGAVREYGTLKLASQRPCRPRLYILGKAMVNV